MTFRCRVVPKTAYAAIAANAVTSPACGGSPASPAYAIATGTMTPQLTTPAMRSGRRSRRS